jgi:hypothetical protein
MEPIIRKFTISRHEHKLYTVSGVRFRQLLVHSLKSSKFKFSFERVLSLEVQRGAWRKPVREVYERQADWTPQPAFQPAHARRTAYNLISHQLWHFVVKPTRKLFNFIYLSVRFPVILWHGSVILYWQLICERAQHTLEVRWMFLHFRSSFAYDGIRLRKTRRAYEIDDTAITWFPGIKIKLTNLLLFWIN